MPIDPSLMPTTLDAVHLGLAALVLLLLILQLVLVSAGVVALLRRPKPGTPVAVAIERVPAELAPPAPPRLPETFRVAIDRVPAELIPVAPAPAREAPRPIEPPPERPQPVVVKEATPEAALQFLGLLQKEARFIDFVQEDVAAYEDADIGAVARVVHEGCRKVLRQYFELDSVRQEQENTRITLPKGFDARAVRVSGNIVGDPPFTGLLLHRGWRASKVKLPKLAEGHDVSILAPAEVEL